MNPPIIALDARRLYGRRRGVGQYVFRLVQNLPRVAREFQFLLLADRHLAPGVIPDGCRVLTVGRPFSTESQSISGLFSKVYSIYWMNWLIPRVLKTENVSLFHGTNFAIPIFSRGPYVVTIHDMIYARLANGYERLYRRYHKFLLPRAARNALKVITDSENGKRDIVELLRIAPEKIEVIHLGVDEEFRVVNDRAYLDKVKAELALPDRFILYVGAIERRKNLGILVEGAAEMIKAGLVDALVLAGEEGYGAQNTWIKIREAGIADRVRHIGYVPQEFMCGLYNLARVFTLISPYEGFGIPVLEAMACGTPVVTSNRSSLPEVAGDAAILVNPYDKSEVVAALHKVLTDDSLREELRTRGLKRAGLFSWRRTAERHLEVYKEVLGQL